MRLQSWNVAPDAAGSEADAACTRHCDESGSTPPAVRIASRRADGKRGSSESSPARIPDGPSSARPVTLVEGK